MSCEYCDRCDCDVPCDCDDAPYDADELGLNPEEDVALALNARAAALLLRRPMYPGEIVN